jgi:hypothetical protein
MNSSSNKGRPAAVWKHFSPVIIEMDNGTSSKIKYKCLVCLKDVALAPKEGYRHIKNCEVLSNEDKIKIIAELPTEEVKIYEQFSTPGKFKFKSISSTLFPC